MIHLPWLTGLKLDCCQLRCLLLSDDHICASCDIPARHFSATVVMGCLSLEDCTGRRVFSGGLKVWLNDCRGAPSLHHGPCFVH